MTKVNSNKSAIRRVLPEYRGNAAIITKTKAFRKKVDALLDLMNDMCEQLYRIHEEFTVTQAGFLKDRVTVDRIKDWYNEHSDLIRTALEQNISNPQTPAKKHLAKLFAQKPLMKELFLETVFCPLSAMGYIEYRKENPEIQLKKNYHWREEVTIFLLLSRYSEKDFDRLIAQDRYYLIGFPDGGGRVSLYENRWRKQASARKAKHARRKVGRTSAKVKARRSMRELGEKMMTRSARMDAELMNIEIKAARRGFPKVPKI